MTKSKRKISCRVCLRQRRDVVRWYTNKHLGLGVRNHNNQHICTSCSTTIGQQQPIHLPTHLPIFTSKGHRQHGLFATRHYKKGEFICEYWGKTMYSKDRDLASEYVWYSGQGLVVDGKNATCLAKFANHYVRGSDAFSCNCKVKNKNGKASMYASKAIEPGMELFWNYGADYWKGREQDKLTNKKLKELTADILYRDCDKIDH